MEIYTGKRFPNLTAPETIKVRAHLVSIGLKLPKIGWVLTFPDGRVLAHDPNGFYWVREDPNPIP